MKHFIGLIHADTGAGKTHLAGTMAQKVNVLHVCIDQFAEDTLLAIPGERVIKKPTSFNQLVEYHKYLATGKHDFGGWCLDSITQGVQNFRVELTGASAHDYRKAGMQDWMQSFERWRLLIKDYASLPMHGMILAMSQREVDELEPGTKDSPNYIVKPFIETKLRDIIGGYLPAMGYCYKQYRGGKNVYFISFERGGIDTKLCGASIPQMENPTFEKIWNIITKNNKESTE